MNIYNLDQASREMANIIWKAESREEVDLFISTLDDAEARMALHVMQTMLVGGDDIDNVSDATEILTNIMRMP
jgi:hypothetical protein